MGSTRNTPQLTAQDTTQLARSPLHEWHATHALRMVDFAGWSMPLQYTSIVAEHQATRTALGMFDISHMGRLRVAGPGATKFLDSVLTRRVTDMRPGQIRYSLICHEGGGILDDILVYRLTEEGESAASYLLVVNAGNREKIVNYLGSEGQHATQVEDQTLATGMVAVQGPRAVELVDTLFDCKLHSLGYYTGASTNIGGTSCYLSRTGYTGEDGCEIIGDAQSIVVIWQQLAAAAPDAGGTAAGLAARDTLRQEAGMPLYGHELSATINPVQAGLDFAVNLRGRDFVGRDAIARIRRQGSQPVRVGLQLDGRRVARQGCKLVCDDEEMGFVTSGTFSPTLGRPIAMGYVKETVAHAGTRLVVDVRGQLHWASVVSLPFYRRKK